MTIRALTIGLILVLLITGLGYFIYHVAKLPSLVNGGMPMIVFAVLAVMVLVLNPLLVRCGLKGLGGRELAVIVAMGVVVCAYNSANFFRYLGGLTTIPAHAVLTRGSWQATQVMSYVPGHVGYVAEGQLLDPAGLARRVVGEKESDSAVGRLWRDAGDDGQPLWVEASQAEGAAAEAMRSRLTTLVNRILSEDAAVGHDKLAAARVQLQHELEGILAPPPPPPSQDAGVLLSNGVMGPAIEGALYGRTGAGLPSPSDVPWQTWWPVVRMWVGLMALLVLISVCLAVIVRPQWANHERLAFPIVKFTELMLQRQPGHGLPDVAHSRLFWGGFVSVVFLHTVNILHAWFPEFPEISLALDFGGLRELLPNASRIWQAGGIFNPAIELTVVAFAFFLPRAISLTFGLTTFFYVAFAAMLVARGVEIGGGATGAAMGDLVNFGAMLGMVAAVLYTGRRYYAGVVLRSVGLASRAQPPASAVWACRLVVLLLPLTVLHLSWNGLSPVFAILAVGVVLLLWLVNARVMAETGLFRMGSSIVPVGVAAALFGYEAVGPTQVILLTMISMMFATDLWESPMNYALTGMELTRREDLPQGRTATGLALTAILGLAVVTVATLAIHYRYGLIATMDGPASARSVRPLELAAQVARELSATGDLVRSVEAGAWHRLTHMQPDHTMVGWIALGLIGFIALSAARLRLSWWPIHPIVLVLFGNWGIVTYGFSFLLGWAIKAVVINVGGARAYHNLVPLMCGLIAGGLTCAAAWMIIGTTYFLTTGLAPPVYVVFGQ